MRGNKKTKRATKWPQNFLLPGSLLQPGAHPPVLASPSYPQGLYPSQSGRGTVMDPQEPSANASHSWVRIRPLKQV